MKSVVLHDGSIHPGGAVDVVLHAARVLDADLIIGFSGKDHSWWEERAPNDVRILSRHQRLPRLRDVWLSWKWLNLDIREYDLVLSSGPATKFYQPYDGQRHIHYLHHPPLSALWFEGGLFNYALRTIDRIETWSIPTIIANSELTAKRMRSHYNTEPEAVISPPVDLNRFNPDTESSPKEVVMVGRLEERKRPGIAIEAFRNLEGRENPPHLRFLGDGPLRDKLESDAPTNVSFEGYVTDEELVEAVEAAEAALFLAKREDFGITPVEYLAAGTPVVAVDEPNTNNQITDEETGVLVKPTAESVADGIEQALNRQWDAQRLRMAAEQYGVETFESKLKEVIEE